MEFFSLLIVLSRPVMSPNRTLPENSHMASSKVSTSCEGLLKHDLSWSDLPEVINSLKASASLAMRVKSAVSTMKAGVLLMSE